MTRFIGRGTELARLKQMLERSRLVTLTGVGGVGKSRMALRLAAEVRRTFGDGVWWVDLSALREPHLLAHTVSEALRLPGQASGDQLDQLADHLADRHLLLVLDTCEHLVDGCALLAEVLLRAAPRLRIVATSREPLDILGEHSFNVPPLPVDEEAGGELGAGAVELFADRAGGVLPGFTLDDHDPAAVARLCRRLDGIPLAIELAAVRLRAMSVEQILERLDDRFRLLGTVRSRQGRHQTLRAAIGWSHDLCTAGERLLWSRLSVFPGDFDLPAAEEVCQGDGLPPESVFEVLGRLVEKSIVLRTPDGRYRLLDTLREYGREYLESPDEAGRLRRRHRDRYLAVLERFDPGALGPGHLAALRVVRSEQVNIRAALDYSVATPGEEAAALRITLLLQPYWMLYALVGEARYWFGRVAALDSPPTADRATAVLAFGVLVATHGEHEEARRLIEQGTALAARAGTAEVRHRAIGWAGVADLYSGDVMTAKARLERAVDAYELDDVLEVGQLLMLAGLNCGIGEIEDAREQAARLLRLGEAAEDLWSRSCGLAIRAIVRMFDRDLDAAGADLRECVRIYRAFGAALALASALDTFALYGTQCGAAETAATILGTTERVWSHRLAAMMGPTYEKLLPRAAAGAARHELGEARYARAHERGAALTLDQAAALALGERADVPAQEAPDRDRLTARELEVAGLVAEGWSNREIAERLVISKRTADSHIEHILAKLSFRSRAQIATWMSGR